jgi:hypothetical protein
MMRSLALVGLAATVFYAGCAHECRCVCVDGSVAVDARAVRTREGRVSGLHRGLSGRPLWGAYPSPFARLSSGARRTRPSTKPGSYPDPFESTRPKADPFEAAPQRPDPFESTRPKADPFEAAPQRPDPFESDSFDDTYPTDERMAAALGKFNAAEALEEAYLVSAERAGSERIRQEAKAAERAEELRRHLQQITRP